MRFQCLKCNCFISNNVYNFSKATFGFPLCIRHQEWYIEIIKSTTPETVNLYFALRARGVPAELEKFDGYKTIDIAIPEAKVNIEVDGYHHNTDPQQALADLKRTYYSFINGYLTLRIPNSLVRWDVEETAEYITGFLNIKNSRV